MNSVPSQTFNRSAIRLAFLACAIGWISPVPSLAAEPTVKLRIEQLTFGDKHHFFGYIGQCQTIPWSDDNRYIVGLEVDQIARMPLAEEAASVFVIDTHANNKIIRLDQTRAWNPQQGTMFYWNPNAARQQFFFNDRDGTTGKVFTVLYDSVSKNSHARRLTMR
jgi:hypothetical protein